MIIAMLGIFGFILWNQKIADENTAKENKKQEKQHEAAGLLLLDASCNRKKQFRQLLVENSIGQQYAFANFDSIYAAAKSKNNKNCSLLTRPVALSGVGIDNNFSGTRTSTPDGWESTSKEGVFTKWCKEGECDTSKIVGEQRYAILLVWCKDAPCGDIYGQVNLYNSSGIVVGFTNDTGYGSLGDKVQLTFSSYQDFSRMQVTELNLR